MEDTTRWCVEYWPTDGPWQRDGVQGQLTLDAALVRVAQAICGSGWEAVRLHVAGAEEGAA